MVIVFYIDERTRNKEPDPLPNNSSEINEIEYDIVSKKMNILTDKNSSPSKKFTKITKNITYTI